MDQPEYLGPDRRRSNAPYNGPERRKLDWPFKPLNPDQRSEGIAPTTTPGRRDVTE